MNKKLLAAAVLSVLLGACATTTATQGGSIPAQAAVLAAQADEAGKGIRRGAEQNIIAYYNADSELSDKPMRGGYYRVLLGRDAQGRAVVQDFYQDTQTKQINPVVLPDDNELKNFDVLVTEGRTIWYTPEGRVTNFTDVRNGKSQRSGYYDEQGRLVLSIEGDLRGGKWLMSGYYENGQPLFAVRNLGEGGSERSYFYESGRLLSRTKSDGMNAETVQFWKEDGSEAEGREVADVLSKVIQRANYLSNKYLR